ncbi:MAG: hypothetical protein ACLTDV_03680 [Eubacterium sp.]
MAACSDDTTIAVARIMEEEIVNILDRSATEQSSQTARHGAGLGGETGRVLRLFPVVTASQIVASRAWQCLSITSTSAC